MNWRHDLPKLVIERLRVIVRLDLASKFPEALVLRRIVSLALPALWFGGFALCLHAFG
jgi:hypothetical protein